MSNLGPRLIALWRVDGRSVRRHLGWLLCRKLEASRRRATVRAVCCHKENYEIIAAW